MSKLVFGSRLTNLHFSLALVLLCIVTWILSQDVTLSFYGVVYLLISIVAVFITYIVLFHKSTSPVLLFLSIVLPCILNIISVVLSWGIKPLGHEDFGRDVRWSKIMDVHGFWKHNIEAGVYTAFPVQSYINYVFRNVILYNADFEISGFILMLLLRILIAIAIYLIIVLLRFENIKYVLPLITLFIGGTTISAYLLSGILTIIALYRSLIMCSSKRFIPSEIVVVFILSLTSVITHIGAFSILVTFATVLLISHLLKRWHSTIPMFSTVLMMLPIAYSIVNYAAFRQVSGFVETLIRTIYNPGLVEMIEFSATIQMYGSHLWLLRYIDLLLYPLIFLTLLMHMIRSDKVFRSNKLFNTTVTLILLVTVVLQHALGVVSYMVSRNSTYYRYFSSISAIFVILLSLIYMDKTKIGSHYVVKLSQTLLYVLLLVSALIAQLHHTSAPLLHFNKDLVSDRLSHTVSTTAMYLIDETFALNVYSIFLPIGNNPYGTLDYWVIRYNIERGNVPRNTIIMAIAGKNPLGSYLYRELILHRAFNVDLLLSTGNIAIVYYGKA